MLRCAIYVRVSTEEQKINGLSVEAQTDALIEYAEKNNLYVIDSYIDAGLTARKRLQHRKELLRLLEDVKEGKMDIIIFTKLDRWFRNIADYYKVQEILDKYKVNWKTIYEDYDTSTANGRLHINIMLSIAQDEADRTSERIKVVFENKRAKGEVPGWKAPLGYKIENSKLLVDDNTKQIAIDIFQYYDLHRSVMGCARMAREKHNYKIYDYSIRRMFENKTYIGEFRDHKNFCEAIIDTDLFYRIKNYREVREFKNQLIEGRVYLFSSLVICNECNHAMTSCYARQQQKHGLKEFHYYRCKEAYLDSCIHKKRINEDTIEEFLLQNVVKELRQHILKIETKEKLNKGPTVDIAALRKRLDKLKDLYLDGLIDKDSYRLEYESINRQISDANVKPKSTEKYKELLHCDFMKLYNSFSLQERKSLWLGIIDHITVDENKHIEIFFK